MSGQIEYNGKTLALPNIVELSRTPEEERYDNFGQGDPPPYESISFGGQDRVRMRVQRITRAQAFAFFDWWSWARKGNQFSLALYDDKDRQTTVTSHANAGQSVIPMTATSLFVAGDYCLIKQNSGDNYEVVEVSSVNTDVALVAGANLSNSYSNEDIFRHVDYWPNLITDERMKGLNLALYGPGTHQDLTLDFVEVASAA